jgi:membrane AbrB-like protein
VGIRTVIDLRKTFRSQLAAVKWMILIFLSGTFAGVLQTLQVSAAPLIGPLCAAILVTVTGVKLRLPRSAFLGAQGIIGCMIARGVSPPIDLAMFTRWPLLLATVLAIITASSILGWLLARRGVLPGAVAVWGSSPGAANVMVLMADAHDADIHLVAFMQYLRLVVVTLVASIAARVFVSEAQLGGSDWFPTLSWSALLTTLALITAGVAAGRALKIPAGPLLLPMALGAALQSTGFTPIELPPWLLAFAYALLGWHIGLRFSLATLTQAARAFPKFIALIFAQLLICGGLGTLLTSFAGVDMLTAFLATSPGGADSIAIIAASAHVDLGFVMAMQTLRLVLVILISPALCRAIVRHLESGK